MNDKQFLVLLKSIISEGLADNGFTDVDILRSYQVTQQGVPERASVYLHKYNSPNHGHPSVKNNYNSVTEVITEETRFWKTPSWQISARVIESTDVDAMTAGDLIGAVADIVNLSSTIERLIAANIGVERVSEVRDVYEVNDKDRYEHVPNFDLTLTYSNTYTSTVTPVDTQELDFYRV